MPGRNILEGVVMLHETIDELHRKKIDGVLFKIDLEKECQSEMAFLAANLVYERIRTRVV
jgi:hypothetical protein